MNNTSFVIYRKLPSTAIQNIGLVWLRQNTKLILWKPDLFGTF